MIFYRQTIDTSPKKDDLDVGKLIERARKLPESVPSNIREELAGLLAEINGGNAERKKLNKAEADILLSSLEIKARNGLQKYVREGKAAELRNNQKYRELLGGAKGFDSVRAGDVLRLRGKGEDVASFLLTLEDGDEVDTSAGFEKLKGKKMLVNFGDNRSINASIGLGDILPAEVKKVEITKPNGETIIGTLGTRDMRAGRKERVGYYDTNGKYIPVYSGYAVRILETGLVEESDKAKYATLIGSYTDTIRVREMHERRKLIGEKYKEEFQDAQDQELFGKVEQYGKNRENRRDRARETYGDAIGRERFIQLFGSHLNEVCKTYNTPPKLVLQLFDKESSFNFTALNTSTQAYGLGQIIPTTWLGIENKILMTDLDQEDPKDQILASVALLSDIKNKQGVSWQRAAILYHTGESLLSLSKDTIDEYLRKNAKEIRESFMGNRSTMTDREYAEAYAQAAEKYFGFSSISDTRYVELEIPKSEYALAGHASHAKEYTETGTTACSRTAWRNLREFGILDAPRGGSAKESEGLQSASRINHTTLLGQKDYNVVDIYLDSTTEAGSVYGHRAVGVRSKSENIWYVLDPYYGTGKPVPLDAYLSNYRNVNGEPNPRYYGYSGKNYLAKAILA